MELFDTHCHLNHPDYDDDREEVAARARSAGVSAMLTIGYDMPSSRRAAALTAMDGVYAAIGVHPESAKEWTPESQSELRGFWDASQNRVAAYGEIGLDYHWDTQPRDHQQQVFAEQIAFAASLDPRLPLIIHCRDAQDDVLRILRESATPAPVVMHCFTGDTDTARACLDAGCWLGIGGVATYKKSDALRVAIAYAPLDRLLLETDCPYLAPQRWRGKRNEPSYLTAVAAIVADARGISPEDVAQATTHNARFVFRV
ncbi:TatD-related deoxyribonuclease [Capsulimonas corticalis]|uniref:TatD-related deoxyribonuclease n=1 Tax=Capsulimonas corticalis TaxID=2219043 RepID=A0A402CRN3_9BACT|nr:TatD family hydrolase [Capsulimonas corticalis]BDI28159.1 TatD-related deoxyribonuclease [Capsulimonas corticalis]